MFSEETIVIESLTEFREEACLVKIDADRYTLFPRIDGEVENATNWTVATVWTTSSGASSSMM